MYPREEMAMKAGAENPSRIPQIQVEGKELEHALAELQERIEVLKARLCPVLSDNLPDPRNEKVAVQAPLVALANVLRERRYDVRRAIGSIDDILQRLEL